MISPFIAVNVLLKNNKLNIKGCCHGSDLFLLLFADRIVQIRIYEIDFKNRMIKVILFYLLQIQF